MSSASDRRERLREACREVLAARIDVPELRRRWGEVASSGSSFERVVFRDLLDVLEDGSGPGLRRLTRLVGRRPRAKHDTLRLDLRLLAADPSAASDPELLRCRYALDGVVSELEESAMTEAAQTCLSDGKSLSVAAEVSNTAGLGEVTDHIHDCWFDLEDIEHDRDRSTVTVPFRCGPRDTVRRLLRFQLVRGLLIRDTEQIGTYDFNKLVYDPTTERIRVETNIPLGMEVEVGGIQVTVETSR